MSVEIDHGAAAVDDATRTVQRWTARVWVHLVSLFLVVLVFVQNPRMLSADTKLDLSVDPVGFLARALSLWDPQAAAGQLQNQAYGYLFPMGPFFAVLHAVGLPPWVIQRLWWCLVLLVAFHGVRRLLDRLGVGTPSTQLLAALTYALSPRLLGVLGAVSSEVWPMAIAPWVLLPLVRVPHGAERRRAAWSAIAVACAGGINAVATAAVLPLPAVWLLRGVRERTGRRLAAWWALCVGLATLWWAVPLVLLGRYSPPFLDWIESASVTTSTASLPEALRGTTHWIAALPASNGPLWPAAYQILTTRTAVGAGLLLALGGLAGIVSSRLPHRRFWAEAVVLGLVLLTLGHTGPGTPPWAPAMQHLLDGPLAPLRNIHKFDPVVRLSLAVGLAHGLARAARLRRRFPLVPGLVTVVVVSSLVMLTAPAALVGIAQRGSFEQIPDWWRQTADYLADQPLGGRTLVVPGASFATSYWGDPRDEPLQPLARSPWIVRDGVPLGSGGATRLLNRVEQSLSSGHGGDELAALLIELNVTRVVQRADLDWRTTGAPPPLVVRQALRSTPGLVAERTFGPLVGGSARADVALADGLDQPVPTIQVWGTGQPDHVARLVPTTDVSVRSGGSESPSQTSVLAGDARSVRALRDADGGSGGIVTDTLQRREANFAAVRDVYSTVLAARTPYPAERVGHDWMPTRLESSDAGNQTTLSLQGVGSVTASSSRADPAFGSARYLAAAPASALDGNGDSAWVSAAAATGQSWQVSFLRPVELRADLDIVVDAVVGADVAQLVVSTDRGSATTNVAPLAVASTVSYGARETAASRRALVARVPAGPTSRLRVTVAKVRGDANRPASIVEVGPGVLPQVIRRLVVPPADGTTNQIRLDATADRRDACAQDDGAIARCQPSRARQGEESLRLDRSVSVQGDAGFNLTGTVRARFSPALDRLLDAARVGPAVTGSSTWVPDAVLRPSSAADGDPRTYWAPAPDDPRPTLHLLFQDAVRVTGLRIETDAEITGSRPTQVRVRLGDGQPFQRTVDIDGAITVPSVLTRSISIEVIASTRTVSFGSVLGPRDLPVVVGEVEVKGAPDPVTPGGDDLIGAPCGFGPSVLVDGRPLATAVEGTRRQVESGAPVRLRACEKVHLTPGRHDITALASGEFEDANLTFDRRGRAATSALGSPAILSWGAVRRELVIAEFAGPRLLVVAENENDGWSASLGGHPLTALVVDGWQQGFLIPADAQGNAVLSFAPQRPFRAGLLAGAMTLILVLGLALLPARGSEQRARGAPRPLLVGSGPWIEVATALVSGFLLAGGLGVVVAGAVLIALAVLRTRATDINSRLLLVLLLGASLVAWTTWAPWPAAAATNRDQVAQLLVVALLAVMLSSPRRRAPRLRQ